MQHQLCSSTFLSNTHIPFYKNIFYWCSVALQCCVSFYCIANWISSAYSISIYTYTHSLGLSSPFSSPPYGLSMHATPFYRIQALHLLHAGGLRREKGQVAAVACRWLLCCSGWNERKHPKANEKPQSAWQLRRGEFGLANCGLRQMWGSCWTACCPWHHLHLKNNEENVKIAVQSISEYP